MNEINQFALYLSMQDEYRQMWKKLDILVDETDTPYFNGGTQCGAVVLYYVREFDLSILDKDLPEGTQPVDPPKIVELPQGVYDFLSGTLVSTMDEWSEDIGRNAVLERLFGEFITLEDEDDDEGRTA